MPFFLVNKYTDYDIDEQIKHAVRKCMKIYLLLTIDS